MERTSSQLKLSGVIFSKDYGTQSVKLSEECSMELRFNQKNQSWSLYLTNTEASGYFMNLEFLFSDCGKSISTFESNYMNYIIWRKSSTVYYFQVLIEENVEKNLKQFISTIENYIDLKIANLGEIDNIDEYIDQAFARIKSKKENQKKEENPELNEISKLLSTLKFFDIKHFSTDAKKIYSASGYLFNYDTEKDELKKLIKTKCNLCVYSHTKNPLEYSFSVETEEGILTYDDISKIPSNDLNEQDKMFYWLTNIKFADESISPAMGFIFDEKKLVDEFKKLLQKMKYESSGLSYDELPEEERNWLERENDDNFDIVSQSSHSVAYENLNNRGESERNEENEKSQEEEEDTSSRSNEKSNFNSKNKFTTQSFKHDRIFSARDDNTVEVYKTSDIDDTLANVLNFPIVKEYNGTPIVPKAGAMFNLDSSMLLLNSANPNSIYQYDIPKGQIISEWKVGDNFQKKNIDAITTQTKIASNDIVYGLNSSTIFQFDSRINNQNKITDSKYYKSNPDMLCIATNQNGFFATGSKKGEIRLYDQIGKNAKNRFQCFGDEIKGIDVSLDGRFVLATCDKYLMLIKTSCKSDKNGFITRMGKEKPAPKTLKVSIRDIAKYHLENECFTPARFNINTNDGETSIISSLGEYIVVWNLAKVCKGVNGEYRIKKVTQVVLDNQFKYNRDQIVVTMPNTVRIQNEKKM